MKYILMMLLMGNVLLADDLKDGLQALKNENFKLAMEHFERSANSGNKLALHNIAVMYNSGLGVKRDPNKATKWIEKAVKSDNDRKSTGGYTIEELRSFADYSEKYSKHITCESAVNID